MILEAVVFHATYHLHALIASRLQDLFPLGHWTVQLKAKILGYDL